jgi:hypothetical protein
MEERRGASGTAYRTDIGISVLSWRAASALCRWASGADDKADPPVPAARGYASSAIGSSLGSSRWIRSNPSEYVVPAIANGTM